jgi:hypothetical protein
MSLSPQKPQAFSHMLWFFLVPCLGFLIWASSRWISEIYLKPKAAKETPTLSAQIEKIEKAKNPGDRWQAAYALSHFIQKSLADKTWDHIPENHKGEFFIRLSKLLNNQSHDHRLIKYAILMLGQLKDSRGLDILAEEYNKNISTEINFFSAWSMIEVLTASDNFARLTETQRNLYLPKIITWLESEDPALRKISSVFLIQYGSESQIVRCLPLLSDPDFEVQWNVAIALASIKDPRGEAPLAKIFSLETLRSVEFKSAKDIHQTLKSAFVAANKLNSSKVFKAIDNLKSSVRPKTPEGEAVLSALINPIPTQNPKVR